MSAPAELVAAARAEAASLPPALRPSPDAAPASAAMPGALRHIYVTSAGDGPRVLGPADSLAHAGSGLPLVLAASLAEGGEFDRAL